MKGHGCDNAEVVQTYVFFFFFSLYCSCFGMLSMVCIVSSCIGSCIWVEVTIGFAMM